MKVAKRLRYTKNRMRNPNLCLVRITKVYIERGKGSIGKVKG